MKRLKLITLLVALVGIVSSANGGIPIVDLTVLAAKAYLHEQGYENYKIVDVDDNDKCLVRYQIGDEEIKTLDVREISKEKPFCQEYMELDEASK